MSDLIDVIAYGIICLIGLIIIGLIVGVHLWAIIIVLGLFEVTLSWLEALAILIFIGIVRGILKRR